MGEFFRKLFDTSDFPVRWQCGNWSELLGWMHIVSDLAIWVAYMGIPIGLAWTDGVVQQQIDRADPQTPSI